MTKRRMISVMCSIVALSVGLAHEVRAADVAVPAGAVSAITTLDNLQAAFKGESNAKARYEAFAVKADEEGYKSVAALFRAAAHSEGIHATKHGAALKELGVASQATVEKPVVKSTQENLEAALGGETEEKTSMYPAFIKQAEADKNRGAARSFKGAMASEAGHVLLFKEALGNLNDWKAAGQEFIVCQICGYTAKNTATLQKCPVCAAPRSKFDLFK
jgi:rubrerythrin